jgi:hypothetical protein
MAYTESEDKTKTIADAKKRKEALDLVVKRFNASETFVRPYFEMFQEFYKLYRSYIEEGRLPWRSNLFIPKTFEIVETIAPRVAMSQRTFKALPVEGMDVQNAEAYTDLLKLQFEKTDMEDIVEQLVKESLIYGTSVCKVSWMDNLPNPEVVDIFDFFFDPKARNDQEMKYAIHRCERDIEDLEENPNYDKAAINRLKEGSSTPDNTERQERQAIVGASEPKDDSRKRFELLEYWGTFKGENYIIVVANREEVLRCDTNPYEKWNPFVVVRDTIVPHEFYGIGEIEPNVSLQNELNDIRNQRLDNIKLNINSMWKVLAGGAQYEEELISRPGGIVHMTRQDGVLPMDRQVVPAEAFTEESIIKSDMERSTGSNSPLSGALVSPMGGSQGGVINRTATAWQGAINQADKRFSAKVNQLKRGLIKIGRKFIELSQQFVTEPQAIRIFNQDGQLLFDKNGRLPYVMPEDIKENFDLTVDIEYLDEFQRFQQNSAIAQAMANVPTFDVAKFMVDALSDSGRKDVEKYILKPQPPAPEQPKIAYQLRGDIMPDAVAQILDKHDNIKTHPQEVGAQMRAESAADTQKAAEIQQLNTNQNGI